MSFKKINFAILCLFYFVAGCNHFIHPANYIKIIPSYLPYKVTINYVSGSLEVVAAQLILFTSTRKYGTWLIIFLLIVFIPAHIYLIQLHGCVSKDFCFPEWMAWVRLFPLQFILMWWAYKTWKVQIETGNEQ